MIQTLLRELNESDMLIDFVEDVLAFAYDEAEIDVNPEDVSREARLMVEHAAGPARHPAAGHLPAEYSQDQAIAVFQMALDRVAAVRELRHQTLGRIRIRLGIRRLERNAATADRPPATTP